MITEKSPWIRKSALPLLFFALTALARAQSALDGFDPNANGTIRVVVVQPDGKILLGGSFTTLSPNGVAVTRNHIARLNPDGSLDSAFNPDANGIVYAIALQADGKILAGGVFTNIGGQTRNRMVRLDAATGLPDSFDPNANSEVYEIAVQANGKILAGGLFTSVGGQPRNFIARLDPATGLADSFNPSANNSVTSIAVQGDGKIVAGGAFNGPNSIGGATRNFIARLDPTTGLADSFDPNANSVVFALALQADGKILVGGGFTNIGGQARNSMARLDPTTGLADSFDPNPNDGLTSIVVQADGKILVSGLFNDHGSGVNSIGGATRNFIARLDPTTGLADSFDPKANSSVYSIAVQPDGKILTGGAFTTLAPNGGTAATRNRIARLEVDGRLDQTLDLGGNGTFAFATAMQPDGKILIGGMFTSVLGVPRRNLARLNSDGTVDAAFNPDPNGQIYSIVVQADGKILVGGTFSSIGGQTRNCLARLDSTTGLADSFDAHAGGINSIVVQPDGRILVGGSFSSVGGQPRRYIARLDPTTGLPDSFDPHADSQVDTIALQGDGRILVGGWFQIIGGQPRSHIARLDPVTGAADSFEPNAIDGGASWGVDAFVVQPDGKILAGGGFRGIGGRPCNYICRLDPNTGLADSLDPNASGPVYSIMVQADGRILAGGLFNTVGGQTRNHIARLDPITGGADSFDPNSTDGNGGGVYSITPQTDGKILASGEFATMGGLSRNGFARLSNDTAATQDLVVTQSAISWRLGGSNPRFTGVTLEYSTDNLNYTFLGNGTVSGSSWSLAGLNFSFGQNFYVRARGRYRSGYRNNSESIMESVRNVFLAEPTGTPSPTPVSTPTLTPTPTPTPTPPPTPIPSPTPPPTPTPNPGCTDDTWTATNLADAPTSRAYHTAVWTGSEMIVWGGMNGDAISGTPLNTGGRYDPSTDSWTPVSTANAPTPRLAATAVWTGSEMIVWGGYNYAFGGELNTGGRYNPATDSWTAISVANVPSARDSHTAIWTGTEMIVWGGYDQLGLTNTGARYNPLTDTWTPITVYNAPWARFQHTALWTGSAMIVWGGAGSNVDLNTGGRYNPLADTWIATNIINMPATRDSHTGVWTGNKMVVWGGWDTTNHAFLDTGGIYDPTTNGWTASTVANAPPGRYRHTAVSTGGEMIVWGGSSGTSGLNTGGRYNLGTDGWRATSIINAPSGRDNPTAVWTGGEMIVWGGTNPNTLNTGGRYCAQQPPASTPPPPTPTPPTVTPTPALTPTPGTTSTPTVTASPASTPTPTPTPVASPTPTPVTTPTPVATSTPTPVASPTPTPIPSPTSTPIGSPTPTSTPTGAGILGNISTRLRVETGDNVLIGGFIITGTEQKKIILRAIGPSLPVAGALADPVLELRDSSGELIQSNDNWRSDQEAEIIASTIPPTNDLESAIVVTLAANNSAYTAVVRGVNNGTGIGAVEAYDLDQAVDSKLANISTRGLVQTGDNVLIGGLIVLGQDPLRVIVRAIGPTLPVAGALGNPTLELRDGNGGLIAFNDNWRSDQEAEIIATTIPPSNDLESAIVQDLTPGNYTALVRGVNGTTGVAAVEAYDLN